MAGRSSRKLSSFRRALRRAAVLGRITSLHETWPRRVFLLAFAVVFVADLLNSFGLDEASDRAWNEMISGINGPLYGSRHGRIGQASIVVVLIGQGTYDLYGQDGGPLAYAAQGEILKQVAQAGPAAIFWDVHYPRARTSTTMRNRWSSMTGAAPDVDPAVAALSAVMKEVSAHRPLLMGPVSTDPALGPLARLVRHGERGVESFASGVHEVGLDIGPRTSAKYPIAPSQPVGTGEQPLPGAVALYRAFCASRMPAATEACEPGQRAWQPGQKMVVQWGLGVSEWARYRLPDEQRVRCMVGTQWLTRLGRFLWLGAARAFVNPDEKGHDDRDLDADCGYHDFVPVERLEQIGPDGKPLATMLRDRIVLVGFDLGDGGDRRDAQFYGDVPGVLIHAMALDNLIESGGRPQLEPSQVWLGIDELDLVQYFGVLAVVIVATLLSRGGRTMFRKRDGVALRMNIVRGVLVSLIVLIGVVILIYSRIRGWPVSSTVVSGLLPGGIMGVALMFFARASAGRESSHGS